MLHESPGGEESEPTRQHYWELAGTLECDTLPHRNCISMHAVPNVRGPLRGELMTIVAVMLVSMKSRRFEDHEIFPVSLFFSHLLKVDAEIT
jgi:hypothetical protein